MEFVINTDLEKALPAVIDFNFEQLKHELTEKLKLYNGLVVTEDAIKEAKADRAKLSKLRDAIDGKRKEVKNACLAPYTAFEKQTKELVELINEPIGAIDKQLNEYEEQRKAKKRVELEEYWNELTGGEFIVPLPMLWRDEWLNATYSLKKAKEDIETQLGKVNADLDVIGTVDSEFAGAVKIKYLDTLDIRAALQERVRLQEQAARLKAYEEQKKAAKAAQESDHTLDAARYATAKVVDAREGLENAKPGDIVSFGGEGCEQDAAAPEAPKVYKLSFVCAVTLDQANKLKAFLEDNNIEYRRI
jgi:hypothetical protein